MPQPEALILAGPNGAGKTTASSLIVPTGTRFLNADLITEGLVAQGHSRSGLDVAAGRVLLRQLGEVVTAGESFCVETNLADRGYARRIDVWHLDELAEAIREAVPRAALPDGETFSLFRVYAVLLLAKGEEVRRADVHNAWVAWMAGEDGDHESLVPFSDLDAEAQAEDSPFVAAIRTVARSLNRG